MMRKGEANMKTIVIGMVLLSMVSIGLVGFMNDMLNNYASDGAVPLTEGEMSNYSFMGTGFLGKMNETTAEFSSLIEAGQEEKPDLLQTFLLAPSALWSAIKIVFQLPAFMLNLITGMFSIIGIPAWVTLGLTVIIVVIIALIALNAIIGWRF